VLLQLLQPVSCRWASSVARKSAATAGADGVLITDLTPEEAGEYRQKVAARGLDTIFLVCSDFDRCALKRIADPPPDFCISSLGRG